MNNYLLTGASGYLGQYILNALDAPILQLGRTKNNDISIDLSEEVPRFSNVDIVIHNAGKAHVVPKNKTEAQSFFDINHQGTLNLLTGLESCAKLPRQFIFISTVAVYGKEEGELISENHPLGGTTPYAKSKILAEQAIQDWCILNEVKYVILRLPLVVGKNAPGNLGAIKRAIQKGYYFRINENNALKSAVLAEDVARLIPKLLEKEGIYNLTDGVHPTFSEIENAIAFFLNKKITAGFPKGIFTVLGKCGDLFSKLGLPAPLTTDKIKKIISTLTFSDQKARNELGWEPRPVTDWIRENGC